MISLNLAYHEFERANDESDHTKHFFVYTQDYEVPEYFLEHFKEIKDDAAFVSRAAMVDLGEKVNGDKSVETVKVYTDWVIQWNRFTRQPEMAVFYRYSKKEPKFMSGDKSKQEDHKTDFVQEGIMQTN